LLFWQENSFNKECGLSALDHNERMILYRGVFDTPSITEEGRFTDETVIATSDTVILDKIERSFDIPDFIIRNVFQKDILDLEMIMMQKSGN